MTEPQTEAGRSLLDNLQFLAWDDDETEKRCVSRIRRIERQAADAALAALAETVRTMVTPRHLMPNIVPREVVLDAIATARKETK